MFVKYNYYYILTICCTIATAATVVSTSNDRPIIGILTQELSNFVQRLYKGRQFDSYIAASYVKFVEGAGGRVIPIWINQTRVYYENLLSKINGVLIPGGASLFNQSYGYAEAGQEIYDIAVKMNDAGDYMPIWGTCLGFELLVYLTANATDFRSMCLSSAQALPLEFQTAYENSRLFGNASNDIINIFKDYSVTANFHKFCYRPETFAAYGQNDIWNVLSLNKDWSGDVFISSIEHKKYPFYGVQFHPEKNLYEWIPKRNISHTSQAIRASQYMGDFFINEARKNSHYFTNESEENNELIYNYVPYYTGALGSAFEQQYLFEKINNKTGNITATAGAAAAALSLHAPLIFGLFRVLCQIHKYL